jgi:transcriptional regulator with XRE-family HTH domain
MQMPSHRKVAQEGKPMGNVSGRVNARTATEVDFYVGQRLRQLRDNRDLSQVELAAALGISFQQLQKYERGANRLSASRLFALARCLGVPVREFFDGLEQVEAATGGDSADDGILELAVRNADALELLKLFDRIEDRAQRRKVIELVAIMAKG